MRAIKWLRRWIVRFGRSLFFASGWLGVLYLPKDADEAPAAAAYWKQLVMSVDREAGLIVFSGLLVLWIIWRDLRPILVEHWPSFFHSGLSIEFDPKNAEGRFWGAATWRRPDGEIMAAGTEYRLKIVNNTDKTIAAVSGDIFRLSAGDSSSIEFIRGRVASIDIAPRSSEFAKFILVTGDQTTNDKFTVRVFGRDAREVTKSFTVDSRRTPAIEEQVA